jgi:hypothetical protein
VKHPAHGQTGDLELTSAPAIEEASVRAARAEVALARVECERKLEKLIVWLDSGRAGAIGQHGSQRPVVKVNDKLFG